MPWSTDREQMHNLFDDRSKCFAHVEVKISNWLHDERARDKGAGETKLLFKYFHEFEPNICCCLHDQGTHVKWITHNKNYSNRAASSELQLIEGSAIFGATVNVLHLRAGSPVFKYFCQLEAKISSLSHARLTHEEWIIHSMIDSNIFAHFEAKILN